MFAYICIFGFSSFFCLFLFFFFVGILYVYYNICVYIAETVCRLASNFHAKMIIVSVFVWVILNVFISFRNKMNAQIQLNIRIFKCKTISNSKNMVILRASILHINSELNERIVCLSYIWYTQRILSMALSNLSLEFRILTWKNLNKNFCFCFRELISLFILCMSNVNICIFWFYWLN